jgi:hypothetical protein
MFRVQDAGYRVQGSVRSGFGVQGLGLRMQELRNL